MADQEKEEALKSDKPDQEKDEVLKSDTPDQGEGEVLKSDVVDQGEGEVSDSDMPSDADIEARLKALDDVEKAIDNAYKTGKTERAKITQAAQLDAAEAVAMAGMAMEADVAADEAMRITVIAEESGDRVKAKEARKKEREARKKAREGHKAATKSARQAYDAIRFSDPNKMGFMRAVQVIFAIHIAMVLVWLMLTSRDAMVYNVTTIMDWIMVILEGVAFWMFINRYKIARPFVIGMAVVGLAVPAIFDIASGTFNLFAAIGNGAFYIFLILYFLFSRRVKATLVNDLGKQKGDYEKDTFVINRHGWPFIRNLIIYFIVFSIVGHWMEMGMCQFIIMGIVQGEYDPTNTMLWRDWLYPFPMEGFAVVAIALVLYPLFEWLKKKFTGKRRWLAYLISFLSGALLCTVIEFSMGLIVNDHYQLWDYRDNFGNIMGQVCLQNTAAFGVVAAIITWWVYPMLERLISRVREDVMNIAFVVIAVFGAIVWSLYLINPPGVDDQNLPENKENQALVQQDYQKIQVGVALYEVDEALNRLDRAIDGASELDKSKLKADAAKIREQVKSVLIDDVGLKEFPSDYDRLISLMRDHSKEQKASQ